MLVALRHSVPMSFSMISYHTIEDLDGCSIAVPAPPLRPSKTNLLCLRILSEVGGISSITEIHRRMQGLRTISRAQAAKILQSNSRVKALGGGYY